MRYVLVLDKPIRIGLNVFECVGPFESFVAAVQWYQEELKDPLPGAVVRSMIDPDAV